MELTPTVGRIVHYKLSANDIDRRMTNRLGNAHMEGDTVRMLIVKVWPSSINGQAFLDGNDTLWITSAHEGNNPGEWSWPPRP